MFVTCYPMRGNQLLVSATRWPGGPRYILQLLFGENHIIAKNSTITKARENISTDLESLEFLKIVDACFTKFEHTHILLNKINHRFLLTTKLFTG
jgi:hypothetical protein